MSRKLKAVFILATALMLLLGCGEKDSPPISSDLAYEYAAKLEDYVAKTGDDLILIDHFLDDMDLTVVLEQIDRDLLLEFMEDYIADAYSEGWDDCYDEIVEDMHEYRYWDGYYDGELDGYAVGYADGSAGLPYNEDMVRPPNNGYTGYIPQE